MKALRHSNHANVSLNTSMFLEDMTVPFSIELSKRSTNNAFYSIESSNDSIFSLYDGGSWDLIHYDMDNMLQMLSHDVLWKGFAFVRIKTVVSGGKLKGWHFEPIHWDTFHKQCKKYEFRRKNCSSNVITIPSSELICFSLNDFGFHRGKFKRMYRALTLTDLSEGFIDLNQECSSYDFTEHHREKDFALLQSTKEVFWYGRNQNNEFLSEPYRLYRRSKYIQLKLQMLDVLIRKINVSIQTLCDHHSTTGRIEYQSCFSEEEMNNLWILYEKGEIDTTTVIDYFYQY